MNKILSFFRLSPARKCMAAEAFFLSLFYRLQIKCRPFPALARHWGTPGLETSREAVHPKIAADISWAVGAVCRRTPWHSSCLVQALTARKMLIRRGLSCTLYMGARRDKAGHALAHAWLRSGKKFIAGGDGSLLYAVTSVYGTKT